MWSRPPIRAAPPLAGLLLAAALCGLAPIRADGVEADAETPAESLAQTPAGTADCASATPGWFTVWLNGQRLGDGLLRRYADRPGLWLEAAVVEAHPVLAESVRLSREGDEGRYVALASMAGLRVAGCDARAGTLDLRVPGQRLAAQALRARPSAALPAPTRGRGLLLDYDLFARQGLRGEAQRQASALTTVKAFDQRGTLRLDQLLRVEPEADWLRLDWRWEQPWLARQSLLTVGDRSTAADAFGRRFRSGGLALRRAFEQQPLTPTYPLPAIAGNAQLPSTLDLYIDGVRQGRYQVGAGPFLVQGLPPATAGGLAELVVTDIQGEVSRLRQPFYVFPSLLRGGLWDYSLGLGATRRDFGRANARYDEWQADLRWRHGWSDRLTLEGGAYLAASGRTVDLGFASALGQTGLRFAGGVGVYGLPQSGSGGLWRAELGWRSRHAFAEFRHRHAHGGSRGDADLPYRVQQWGQLGARFGRSSLSLLHTRRSAPEEEPFRRRALRLTHRWQRLPGQVALEWFREELDGQAHNGAQLNWIWVPRTRWQYQLNADDAGRFGALLRRQPEGELGAGVVASVARDAAGEARYAAEYTHRGSRAAGRLRLDEAQAGTALSAGLQGSLGQVDGHRFLGRETGEAFALVADGGLAGLTVLRNRQPVARTRGNGALLIPNLRPYEENRISLQPAEVPLGWRYAHSEQRLVPGRQSGALIDFGLRREHGLWLRPLRPGGRPLTPGTRLYAQPDHALLGFVGSDGRAYVDLAGQTLPLRVQAAAGEPCVIQLQPGEIAAPAASAEAAAPERRVACH